MNKIYKIFSMLVLLSAVGCADFLDQVPDDFMTIDEVFQKKAESEKYLANVYSYVKDESPQWVDHPWGAACDEIESTWQKYDVYKINIGNWNASTPPYAYWESYYDGIRSATYFINRIDENDEIRTLDGQGRIDQYKAEARFLRAYYYFMLMRQYGPIVLIGNTEIPVDAPLSDISLPRFPFDECVEYVVSELDAAAEVLPLVPENNKDYGRATKGAALAAKARLLLYAASPLYNGNTTVADYKNLDGTNLISQTYNQEKWKRAADAAKDVIDLGIYELYEDASGDALKSVQGVFSAPWNEECIWVRKTNNLPNWDVHCTVRRAGGWSGVGIVQQAVDAFFMKDGLSIEESPLYSEQGFTDGVFNMYLNREPRFYASVLYSGATYVGGSIKDPVKIDFSYNGMDGKSGAGDDYTPTGYLVRKNVEPGTNRVGGEKIERPYILIRLAEMYLSYAEALAEYGGNETEVLKYVNLIRKRAGIPEYGTKVGQVAVPTGDALIQAVRNERRVELMFECHRFFDIRRWMIASDVMGAMYGMNVDANGEDFFKRTNVNRNHLWRSSYYWWPIQQFEMDRGDGKLVQSPGW